MKAYAVVRTDRLGRATFSTKAAAMSDIVARGLEGRALVLEFDSFMPERSESYVYVVQAGVDGPVKIGWTADARARLTSLAVDNAAPLFVLAVAPGTMRQEKDLHAHFAAHRIRSEWYRPAPEILTFARDLGSAHLVKQLTDSLRGKVHLAT